MAQNSDLTFESLGEKLGLKRSTVHSMKAGKSLPSFETLLNLARVFNVSLDSLVGWDKGPPVSPLPEWLAANQPFLLSLDPVGQKAVTAVTRAFARPDEPGVRRRVSRPRAGKRSPGSGPASPEKGGG
jgi:transcriptional regulator with XRE-family HTH domain